MYKTDNSFPRRRSINDEKDDEYDEISKEISKVLINMKQKDSKEFKKANNSNQSSLKTNISVEENSQKSFNSNLSKSSLNEILIKNESENYNKQNDINEKLINGNILNNNSINKNVNINQVPNIFFPKINYEKYNQTLSNNNQTINKNQKNKKPNLDSPKLMIHLDNVLKFKDKRTTLIIRNIPNKYTMELFQNEINEHFYGKYDILYLPLDFINRTNLGFGFINFIDPIHILYFYSEFIGKKWNIFNSEKRCQLAYAKIQGKNSILKYICKKNVNNVTNIPSYYFFIENNSFRINEIEIPMKYYISFIRYYPFCLCHRKNNNIFIVDKYFNF